MLQSRREKRERRSLDVMTRVGKPVVVYLRFSNEGRNIHCVCMFILS